MTESFQGRARDYPRENSRTKKLHEPATAESKAIRTLFDDKKITDGQCVDSSAIEAADGLAWIGNERLAEEIEGGVEEDGSGGALAEFVEEAPKARIGFVFDGVNPDGAAFKGKAFESGRHAGFERAERSHEAAIGRTIEELRDSFRGGGKREGVEVLAVLDVLIHVFDDVFGKRRGKNTAIAKSPVSEFSTSLEPSHNFVPQKELRDFREKRFFSGGVLVDDFTVIENRFDFRRGEAGAEVEMRQRLPSGTAESLPGEERRAQGGAGIAGHGLHINVLERAASLEGTDEENVQE